MPLTIAITGSNGMVGLGVTAKALEDGHRVIALDISQDPHPSMAVSPGRAEGEDWAEGRDGERRGEGRGEGRGEEAGARGGGGGKYKYYQLDATDYEAYLKIIKEEGVNAIIHLAATFNRFGQDGEYLTNVHSHEIYNKNSAMSWNTLEIAGILGINRVVLASSVNSIGMIYSNQPRFEYLPLDEKHPFYPEDAYSVSKYACEIQSDAFTRRYPCLRIATLRFHAVTPDSECTPTTLNTRGGLWKDLWGWVSLSSTSNACLSALTIPTSKFPVGHETFFIVAPTIMQQRETLELVLEKFPELGEKYGEGLKGRGNVGLFDTTKARRMLNWQEGIDNSWPSTT